jgi:hypothetical protein
VWAKLELRQDLLARQAGLLLAEKVAVPKLL